MLAMEALGYGCRDNGLIFSLNAHMWSCATPIARFGTENQKRKYLPGLCDGSLIGVQGMTEPESGSDAFSLATSAAPKADGWLLKGSKTFITNAPVADLFVIFATIDRSKGWAGLTAFLVERHTPGLTVGEPFHKMGIRTSPMTELAFDGCWVPAESVLSKPGGGMMVFNHSMDWERSCILAHAVGTMERQLEETVAYAQQRVQFGESIGRFQAVSHKIVDMKVRLEAGRLLLYRLGWMKAQGRPTPIDTAMVKLFLSESWVQSSLDALQIHGAFGYMVESEVERQLRDALASRIYSGTSEIQRNLIARNLGL
jgi:alkylation response protein AidB-like acyl-CoA dehydrogenase